MTGANPSEIEELSNELLEIVNGLDRLIPGVESDIEAHLRKPELEALRARAGRAGNDAWFVIGVATEHLAKIDLGHYLGPPPSRRDHAG